MWKFNYDTNSENNTVKSFANRIRQVMAVLLIFILVFTTAMPVMALGPNFNEQRLKNAEASTEGLTEDQVEDLDVDTDANTEEPAEESESVEEVADTSAVIDNPSNVSEEESTPPSVDEDSEEPSEEEAEVEPAASEESEEAEAEAADNSEKVEEETEATEVAEESSDDQQDSDEAVDEAPELYQPKTISKAAKKALAKSDLTSLRLIIGLDKDHEFVMENEPAVLSSYDGLYLLQFKNEEDAADAFLRYYDAAEFLAPDAAIEVADNEDKDPEEDTLYTETVFTENENPIVELEAALEDNTSSNKKKIVIALVDTGAKKGGNVIETVSLLGDKTKDDNGHGERMVSHIVEEDEEAEIISIKALDKDGIGDVSAVIAAIYYAIERDVTIINLSLSAYASEENAALAEAIKKAEEANIIVVGAAGNQGFNAKYYIPGNVEEAMIVGSCDETGLKIEDSNFGKTVDYNVVSESTSEAAARMSGFLSANGEEEIDAVLNDGLIYATDFEPAEENEEEGEEFEGVKAQDGPVKNWSALVKAINEAPATGETVIQIGEDLVAESAITISKNIKLVSDDESTARTIYRKKKNADFSVFTVASNGSLTLGQGIVMTGQWATSREEIDPTTLDLTKNPTLEIESEGYTFIKNSSSSTNLAWSTNENFAGLNLWTVSDVYKENEGTPNEKTYFTLKQDDKYVYADKRYSPPTLNVASNKYDSSSYESWFTFREYGDNVYLALKGDDNAVVAFNNYNNTLHTITAVIQPLVVDGKVHSDVLPFSYYLGGTTTVVTPDITPLYQRNDPEANQTDRDKFSQENAGFFVTVNGGIFNMEGNAKLHDFKTVDDATNAPKNIAPVYVNGGTVLMTGGSIENNRVSYVAKDEKSKLEAQQIKDYLYSATEDLRTDSAGGMIITNGANVTITNTATIKNNRGDVGGVLLDRSSTLSLGAKVGDYNRGGSINDNIGFHYAGAVLVQNNAVLDMEAGEMSRNVTWNRGGAVWATEWGTNGYVQKNMREGKVSNPEARQGEGKGPGYFNMKGGKLEGNYAFMRGGAINVESNGVNLTSGEIVGNRCRVLGGGIYVEGDLPDYSYTLNIKNGYIGQNTAIMNVTSGELDKVLKSDGTFGADSSINKGLGDKRDFNGAMGNGGGVWICPFGESVFSLINGYSVILDENTKGDTTKDGTDFYINRPRGGGAVTIHGIGGTWKTDRGGKDLDFSEPVTYIGAFGMKNEDSTRTTITNYSGGGVKIYNNLSRDGGGIAANGTLLLGEPGNVYRFDGVMEIVKAWPKSVNTENAYADFKVEYHDGTRWQTLKTGKANDENVDLIFQLDGTADPLPTDAEDADYEYHNEITDQTLIWKYGMTLPSAVNVVEGNVFKSYPLYKFKYDGITYSPTNPDDLKDLYEKIRSAGQDGANGSKVLTVDIVDWKIRVTETGAGAEGGQNNVEFNNGPNPTKATLTANAPVAKTSKTISGEEITEYYIDFTIAKIEQTFYNDLKPTVEKYINYKVHEEISYDDIFRYDVMVYVPLDATSIQIEDQLVEILEFVKSGNTIDGLDLRVLGTRDETESGTLTNDHDANGSGTVSDIDNFPRQITLSNQGRCTIDWDNNKITISLDSSREEDYTWLFKGPASGVGTIRGHWLRLSFNAKLKEDYQNPETLANYLRGEGVMNGNTNVWETVTDEDSITGDFANNYSSGRVNAQNDIGGVITNEYNKDGKGPHAGIANNAKYIVNNNADMTYTSNTVTVKPQVGMISLMKTDKDTDDPLEGVSFTLRSVDGTITQTKTTNADGKLSFASLKKGTYIIEEAHYTGYEDLNERIIVNVSEDGEATYVGVADEVGVTSDGQLTMNGKRLYVDAEDGQIEAEEYYNDYKVTTKETSYPLLLRTSDGTTQATSIEKNGDYRIQVGNTGNNTYYLIHKTTPGEPSIEKNNRKYGESGLPVTMGRAKWVAKDLDNNGVLFLENQLHENKQYLYMDGTTFKLSPNKGVVLAASSDLVSGSDDVVDINIQNASVLGGVEILKKDATTDEPLNGVVFDLYKQNAEGEYEVVEGGRRTTGVDGEGIIKYEDLRPGEYYIREVQGLNGYYTLKDTVRFAILNDGSAAKYTNTGKPEASANGTLSVAGTPLYVTSGNQVTTVSGSQPLYIQEISLISGCTNTGNENKRIYDYVGLATELEAGKTYLICKYNNNTSNQNCYIWDNGGTLAVRNPGTWVNASYGDDPGRKNRWDCVEVDGQLYLKNQETKKCLAVVDGVVKVVDENEVCKAETLSEGVKVEVENKPVSGKIQFKKTVIGAVSERPVSSDNTVFTFKVTLRDKNNNDITTEGSYPVVTIDGQSSTSETKLFKVATGDTTISATINARHGQTIQIQNLPAYWRYTIEEINVPDDYISQTGAQSGVVPPNGVVSNGTRNNSQNNGSGNRVPNLRLGFNTATKGLATPVSVLLDSFMRANNTTAISLPDGAIRDITGEDSVSISVSTESGETEDYTHWSKVKFNLSLVANADGNNPVQAGDYYVVSWNAGSESSAALLGVPDTKELYDSNNGNKHIATVYVYEDSAVIVFTENARERRDIRGGLEILGQVKRYDYYTDVPETFTISIDGVGYPLFNVLPTPGVFEGATELAKSGWSKDGTGKIHWDIDINKTGSRFVGETIIEDSFADRGYRFSYDEPEELQLIVFSKNAHGAWTTVEDYYNSLASDPEYQTWFKQVLNSNQSDYGALGGYDAIKDKPIAELHYGDDYNGSGWAWAPDNYVVWPYKAKNTIRHISDYLGTDNLVVTPESIRMTVPEDKMNDHAMILCYFTDITDGGGANKTYYNSVKMTYSDGTTKTVTDHAQATTRDTDSWASSLPYDSLKITKTVAGKMEKVPNVWFKVTRAGSNNDVDYIYTDGEGIAMMDGLVPGATYYVQELTEDQAEAAAQIKGVAFVPYRENLVVDSTPRVVVIAENENTESQNNDIIWENVIDEGPVEFVNLRYPNIYLDKTDFKGNALNKDGDNEAQFQLIQEDSGNEVVMYVSKNVGNNRYSFVPASAGADAVPSNYGVAPGTYTLRETKAPDTYLQGEDVKVKIVYNQTTKKMEILFPENLGDNVQLTGESDRIIYRNDKPTTGFTVEKRWAGFTEEEKNAANTYIEGHVIRKIDGVEDTSWTGPTFTLNKDGWSKTWSDLDQGYTYEAVEDKVYIDGKLLTKDVDYTVSTSHTTGSTSANDANTNNDNGNDSGTTNNGNNGNSGDNGNNGNNGGDSGSTSSGNGSGSTTPIDPTTAEWVKYTGSGFPADGTVFQIRLGSQYAVEYSSKIRLVSSLTDSKLGGNPQKALWTISNGKLQNVGTGNYVYVDGGSVKIATSTTDTFSYSSGIITKTGNNKKFYVATGTTTVDAADTYSSSFDIYVPSNASGSDNNDTDSNNTDSNSTDSNNTDGDSTDGDTTDGDTTGGENADADNDTMESQHVLITNTKRTMEIIVEKEWIDDEASDHAETEVEVVLIKNATEGGENVEVSGKVVLINGNQEIPLDGTSSKITLNGASHRGVWKAKWTNLPLDDYRIQEVRVAGYDVTYERTEDTATGNVTYKIKNKKLTVEDGKVHIHVNKVWTDGNDGINEIEVELLQRTQGSTVWQPTGTTATLNPGNNWSYTFSGANGRGLPKFDSNGKLIEYSVRENSGLNGEYTVTVSDPESMELTAGEASKVSGGWTFAYSSGRNVTKTKASVLELSQKTNDVKKQLWKYVETTVNDKTVKLLQNVYDPNRYLAFAWVDRYNGSYLTSTTITLHATVLQSNSDGAGYDLLDYTQEPEWTFANGKLYQRTKLSWKDATCYVADAIPIGTSDASKAVGLELQKLVQKDNGKYEWVKATTLEVGDAEYRFVIPEVSTGTGSNSEYFVDDQIAFCINEDKTFPGGEAYNRILITKDNIASYVGNGSALSTGDAERVYKLLKRAIYFGYGNDPTGIRTSRNLSNKQFAQVTQRVIWDLSNHRSDIRIRKANGREGNFRDDGTLIDSYFYSNASGRWTDGGQTTNQKRAFEDLYARVYSDSADALLNDMPLYIYTPAAGGNQQNLLCIDTIKGMMYQFLTVTNTPKFEKRRLLIYKYDSDTKLPMSDVTFSLYEESADSDVSIPGTDKKGTLLDDTLKTDSNGVLITQRILRKNRTYYLVETTPTDYQAIGTIKFTLNGSDDALSNVEWAGSVINFNDQALTGTMSIVEDGMEFNFSGDIIDCAGILRVANTQKKYDLELLKVNGSKTNKPVMKNVEFEIYNTDPSTDDTVEPVAAKSTDDDGKIKFDGLVKGMYYLVEKTPAGFMADFDRSHPIVVTINGDGVITLVTEHDQLTALKDGEDNTKTIGIKVENREVYELPNSGGPGTYLFTILGTMVVALALISVHNMSRRKAEAKEYASRE